MTRQQADHDDAQPTDDQQPDDDEDSIAAYIAETKNTDYGGGKGGPRIFQYHPKTISNIEFRNLVRLAPIEDVEGNPDTVASKAEVNTDAGEGTSPCVSIRRMTEDTYKVESVKQLAPIKEDRDVPINVEPVGKRGSYEYFAHLEKDGVYFQVSMIDNEAQKLTVDAETGEFTTQEAVIRDIWLLEKSGKVELTPYDATPYSEPKLPRFR